MVDLFGSGNEFSSDTMYLRFASGSERPDNKRTKPRRKINDVGYKIMKKKTYTISESS